MLGSYWVGIDVGMSSSHEHDADMGSLQAEKKDEKAEHGHGHSHEHAHGHTSARIVAIGTVTLGGATFAIDREGQIESGAETEFGVELVGGAAAVPSAAWLANPDGTKVCEPAMPEGHDQHWHFNVNPLMPVKKSKFVLRVGEEEAVIDYCRGAQPVNDGILSVFKCPADPEWRGYLELKLHGDAGDLELFLYSSAGTATAWQSSRGKPTPFDVPKETVICLTFPSHAGKSIELRVRNMDKNEDEDGTANMRDGGTNYFIFPGETGADPEWIKGEKWRGIVTVTFEAGGKSYVADPFVLVPHEAL